MKRIFLFFLVLLLVAICSIAWLLLAPATDFDQKSRYLYVYEPENIEGQVMPQFRGRAHIGESKAPELRYPGVFQWLAGPLNVWDKLKPGRFEIKKGENMLSIIRSLRNNQQAPVKLVINKIRTKEDLAKLIGKNFRTDSTTAIRFLTSNDSLQILGVDTNTVMTLVIPDTYSFNWQTPVKKIMQRLQDEHDKFWTNQRKSKATALGLTTEQAYTLASIVEEETNANQEKGNIASVYLNRIAKGMTLSADPTVKYALRDFGLKRIYFGHLTVNSPYNTYKNKGLPPGPICTPSTITIDAVLNSPRTDYLFFVASSNFDGTHHFSSNYAEHEQYAKVYQKALNERKTK
ncbi:endolytic transglycosylase MltG [Filimonas effusa]|uniref:Endolytic murein transglycosylase n=1 Tax=Filimonas effusa TaxID=2508721 RepID=A0A4Q1DBX8_9BACT|nr:endolytic transglycosylase MltG [Filimonas effusa]RXK86305.1 endolytic transglycosylase MltG [Filimonas effusa]